MISTHKSVGGGGERLRRSYERLAERQLEAALGYYAFYPEEIDARTERQEYWTPERPTRVSLCLKSGTGQGLRFLLDEDLPPSTAEISRNLGLDAVSVHEVGRRG